MFSKVTVWCCSRLNQQIINTGPSIVTFGYTINTSLYSLSTGKVRTFVLKGSSTKADKNILRQLVAFGLLLFMTIE